MCAKRRTFTEGEDKFLRTNYLSMPVGDLSKHLEWPVQSIRKRASKLGVSRKLKRWTVQEDEIIWAAWRNHTYLRDVAKQLGRDLSEVSSRARTIGISKWRIPSGFHSGRPVLGFKNGAPVFTHRDTVAKSLGRILESHEIVHHIDFDKQNNNESNLHLFPSRSSHRKAHSSFESIVPTLVRRGIISFDKSKGVYQICEIGKF